MKIDWMYACAGLARRNVYPLRTDIFMKRNLRWSALQILQQWVTKMAESGLGEGCIGDAVNVHDEVRIQYTLSAFICHRALVHLDLSIEESSLGVSALVSGCIVE